VVSSLAVAPISVYAGFGKTHAQSTITLKRIDHTRTHF
jgi:hypothetical protein